MERWRRAALAASLIAVGACGQSGTDVPAPASSGPTIMVVEDAGAQPTPDAASLAPDAGDGAAPAPTATAAPTWTELYRSLFDNPSYPSSCTGSACHDPGSQKGINFASPAIGYQSLQHRIVAGAPSSSNLYLVLESGYMPLGRPKMPAADLDRVRAWIAAGAPND
jgi:hypothetical protein